MKSICWESFAVRGVKKEFDDESQHFIKWKDCVSGSEFALSFESYNKYNEIIKDSLKDKSAGEIVKWFDKEGFQKSFPYYIDDSKKVFSYRDVARLFVLFSYLYNNNEFTNKDQYRTKAYIAFANSDKDYCPSAWEAIRILMSEERYDEKSLNIKVLKGGPYKIKKYFLENNELKDIRGASSLLTYIGEKHIPDFLGTEFINECVIYSGGSNLMCILPDTASDDLGIEIEQEFEKYCPGAQCAFIVTEPMPLGDILNGYRSTYQSLEKQLEERKRHKITNFVRPKSKFFTNKGFKLGDETIDFSDAVEKENPVCCLCRVRKASYEVRERDIKTVCGCCLHKHIAGTKMKEGYFKEYSKHTGNESLKGPDSLEDIKDNNGYVAVIYADGNNMGSILQNVNSLPEMMLFSRTTGQTIKDIVYKGLDKYYKNKFEIVALGGDDIFIIVPGDKSIEFCAFLVDRFNEEFVNNTPKINENKYRTTLSAGVCIGKYKTPIRVLFEQAENKMKSAKDISRKNRLKNCDTGSIDCLFVEDGGRRESNAKKRDNNAKETIFPSTPHMVSKLVNIVKTFRSKKISKSSINTLKREFDMSDYQVEAKLFYLYHQSRNKSLVEKELRDNMLTGCEYDCGYYSEAGTNFTIWKDILNLWNYTGGEAGE